MNRFVMADSLPDRVVLTDDPARVRMIVSHYLDRAESLYEHRGMIGCSGEYHGAGMAVISCGFGESAVKLYLEEAVRLGAREFIYLGDGISLTRKIDLMSVIIAEGGSPELLKRIVTIAEKTSVPVKIIKTVTNDRFWCDGVNVQDERGWDIADFAASAVHTAANSLNVSAAVILTVSENTAKAERISEETRQIGFSDASVLALETLSK
ncbi:MAG: hypothetical protein FWG36_10450 [Oscillospiraceae bacterium]|nr:hypothetical protein [Oscillospiraceae bacterium]